ncbi:unnamed protein product, partial [Laminaria digitata]
MEASAGGLRRSARPAASQAQPRLGAQTGNSVAGFVLKASSAGSGTGGGTPTPEETRASPPSPSPRPLDSLAAMAKAHEAANGNEPRTLVMLDHMTSVPSDEVYVSSSTPAASLLGSSQAPGGSAGTGRRRDLRGGEGGNDDSPCDAGGDGLDESGARRKGKGKVGAGGAAAEHRGSSSSSGSTSSAAGGGK